MIKILTRSVLAALVIGTLAFAAGCSDDDDDNPAGPGDPQGTSTTVWDAQMGAWRSTVDASDYESFAGFSFAEKDTVAASATNWDIALKREVVKLNGGASGNGQFEGADLGAVDFGAVNAQSADGATWEADAIEHFLNDWYVYDPVQHRLTLTRNAYSMQDASGSHFVKFQVDSLSGDLGMGSMGTVHLRYFYQATADSRDLSGAIQTATLDVGRGTGYFDFSTGAQVYPGDPGASTDWDISFNNYELAMNSGPSGPGLAAGFFAYTELQDPTDLAGFTQQPAGAPLFTDIPGSVLTDWYDYNGQTHQLSSRNHVYLLRSGDRLYKMKIVTYYANRDGVPASGVYTFVWNEL